MTKTTVPWLFHSLVLGSSHLRLTELTHSSGHHPVNSVQYKTFNSWLSPGTYWITTVQPSVPHNTYILRLSVKLVNTRHPKHSYWVYLWCIKLQHVYNHWREVPRRLCLRREHNNKSSQTITPVRVSYRFLCWHLHVGVTLLPRTLPHLLSLVEITLSASNTNLQVLCYIILGGIPLPCAVWNSTHSIYCNTNKGSFKLATYELRLPDSKTDIHTTFLPWSLACCIEFPLWEAVSQTSLILVHYNIYNWREFIMGKWLFISLTKCRAAC